MNGIRKTTVIRKMLVAIMIGLLCGFFAMFFKVVLFGGVSVVTSHFYGRRILIIPVVGGLLVGIIRKNFLNYNNQEFGIAEVKKEILNISKLVMKPKDVLVKMLGALITLISGLSAGSMGPIFHMGGAIGANTAYALKEDDDGIRLFIGCGVASCIAGIFNEPLFATVFVLEVIMEGFLLEEFIYIIGSVITSRVINKILYISPISMEFGDKLGIQSANEYILFIILGIFMGIVSKYYLSSIKYFDRIGSKYRNKHVTMGVLVGLLTAFVQLFLPLMYDYFNFVSIGSFDRMFSLVGVLIIVKILLTGITLGICGFGGSFAPGIMIGMYSGIFFWKLSSLLFSGWGLDASTYVLAAIAGIIGGFFDAPLSGTLFVLELTGNYALVLPVLITSVISNFNTKILTIGFKARK